MYWKYGICFVTVFNIVAAQELYDVYFGKPITDKRRGYLDTNATRLSTCTMRVESCRVGEGRRVDGTCSNPKYPTRGATLTPLPRLLPAKFGPGNSIRPAKDGSELPSARLIRTSLLPDGFVTDHPFTLLATHFFVFSIVDTASLDDILKYAVVSDCCVGNTPNRVNPQCISIPIPADDPYTRLTGLRCMNLTRGTSLQDLGCIPNSLPLERANRATPLLDLSAVYGNSALSERLVRRYEDGLLRSEFRGGREIPPGNAPLCVKNRLPVENTCYQYGDILNGNVLIGTNLPTMWFYRQHNRFARILKDLNPCWDDEKIFQTARTINIAIRQHIFYYELIPEIIGKKNALNDGVIYNTKGYVNDYDERYEPGTILEYLQGSRWFHTFQDGRTDLYSERGRYLGTRKTVDDEFRSGILEVNKTEAQLTLGSFRQKSAKFDFVMDPELSERLFGDLQAVSDLISIDIMRGRDVGLPPYNDYRKLCGMPVAKKFEDFWDTIDKGRVETLSRLYDDVDDMEYMTAVYIEKWIKDGWVGPTLYCVLLKNLLLWRKSDLYFYEHGNHPAKLTLPQLNEVRKATIARVLCDNGDGVREIQPMAFLKLGHKNKLVSCDKIPRIDLDKWADPLCYKDYEDYKKIVEKPQGNEKKTEGWESFYKDISY